MKQKTKSYREHLQDQMDPGNQSPVGAIQPKLKPLPPDPEQANDKRAYWAGQSVAAFQRETKAAHSDSVCHLLTCLIHYCDRKGMDFAVELSRALDHYGEETSEEG